LTEALKGAPSHQGEPIHCPQWFKTADALARAEAQADTSDTELETRTSASQEEQRRSPQPDPTNLGARLTKNQKKNLKDRCARNKVRELRAGEPKQCSLRYKGSAKGQPVSVNADAAADLPRSKPAWIGLRDIEGEWKVYSLKELQEVFGLELFDWDGL
jgi:hypothetical protein